MTTEPKFYSRSWVDADCVFTVSHNAADIEKAYDRDAASQWVSDGADDDATPIEIVVQFPEARDVDTVFLQNHNLSDAAVQYWTGSAYAAWASDSSIASSFLKLTGTLRNTTRIKLTANATQTADQEKAIGELMACALAWDPARDMKKYEPGARELASRNLLGNGELHKVLTAFSPFRTQKYEARVQFDKLALEDLEVIQSLKELGDPILFQPLSSFRPDQIFLVHIDAPIKFPFTEPGGWAGPGHTVDLDLKEV